MILIKKKDSYLILTRCIWFVMFGLYQASLNDHPNMTPPIQLVNIIHSVFLFYVPEFLFSKLIFGCCNKFNKMPFLNTSFSNQPTEQTEQQSL